MTELVFIFLGVASLYGSGLSFSPFPKWNTPRFMFIINPLFRLMVVGFPNFEEGMFIEKVGKRNNFMDRFSYFLAEQTDALDFSHRHLFGRLQFLYAAVLFFGLFFITILSK